STPPWIWDVLGPGGSKVRSLLNGITLRAREAFTNETTVPPGTMLTHGREGTIGATVLAARAHPGVCDEIRDGNKLRFLPLTTPRSARGQLLTRPSTTECLSPNW